MSIECGECERDIRAGHHETCSRYLKQCVGEIHDVANTIQADNEGLETDHVKAIREAVRYLERMARGNIDRLTNAAARDLPTGYSISVYTENGAGYVEAWDARGNKLPVETADRSIEEQFLETVDLALNDAAKTQKSQCKEAFCRPVRYEIVNPSDPCQLTAPSFFIAAMVISLLGTGTYGGKPIDDDSAPEVPLLMFGADSWCQQQFGLSFCEAVECAMESHQTELVDCLRSVSYPPGHERTSLNDIVGRAHAIADNAAKAQAPS